MNIYRLVLLILCFLFLFENKIKKNKNLYKILKIFSMGIFIVLATFRGNLGKDTLNYIEYFKSFQFDYKYFMNGPFEYFYFLTNYFVKTFTTNIVFLFFLIVLITVVNIYIFINFFSCSFFYSVVFYYCRWFFLKEFTGIRGAIGCSFLYLALIELYKNNNKKYIFFIVIGGLYHKSILFFLILPIIYYYISKVSFKVLNWMSFITLIILPILYTNFSLKKYVNLILLKLEVPIAYVNGYYSIRDNNITYYFSMIVLIIIAITHNKLVKKFGSKYLFLEKIYFISCLLGAILFGYGTLVGRLVGYLNVEFVLLDKILLLIKNKKIAKICAIIFIIILYILNFTFKDENIYLPYIFKVIN